MIYLFPYIIIYALPFIPINFNEDAEQIIDVEINNIHALHCPTGQSHNSLLEESQRRFLIRVETDVDLISTLLN